MSFVCLLLELITWGFVTASLEHFGAGNGISDLNMVHAGWYICDIEDLPGASQVILVLLPLLLFFFFSIYTCHLIYYGNRRARATLANMQLSQST